MYIPKENENMCPHKNLYMNVCSSLLIIVKKWKQPKCLSNNEWINNVWFIHMVEHYSAMKRNKVLLHAMI